MLVSAKHQHESAIGIYIYPLPLEPPSHSTPPIPPLWVVTEPQLEFLGSHSKFPLAIYFTYGNVGFHITLYINPTLSFLPLPCVHKSVLYVCVSLLPHK